MKGSAAVGVVDQEPIPQSPYRLGAARPKWTVRPSLPQRGTTRQPRLKAWVSNPRATHSRPNGPKRIRLLPTRETPAPLFDSPRRSLADLIHPSSFILHPFVQVRATFAWAAPGG
jgi:hypothetical protein